MKRIVYTYLALIERIEQVHGKLIAPFVLKYPSDPRCQYRLNMHYKGEKDDWYIIAPAEDGAYVSELIGMDVVSVEWHRGNWNNYLTVIVRDEATDEITHEQFEKYLKDHYVSWKLWGEEDIDYVLDDLVNDEVISENDKGRAIKYIVENGNFKWLNDTSDGEWDTLREICYEAVSRMNKENNK